jgi:hypothetical protein
MNLKHIFKIIEKDNLQKAKLSGNYVGSSKRYTRWIYSFFRRRTGREHFKKILH